MTMSLNERNTLSMEVKIHILEIYQLMHTLLCLEISILQILLCRVTKRLAHTMK